MLQPIVYLYIDSIFIPKFMTKRDIFIQKMSVFAILCDYLGIYRTCMYVMH